MDLENLNDRINHGLNRILGIKIVEIKQKQLKGAMSVTKKHLQPFGLLHGGATISLGETLASVAAYLTIDPDIYTCVGQHVDANHIKSVIAGDVFGIARLAHKGRRSQLWDVEIYTHNHSRSRISAREEVYIFKA